jgi:uroporphyrin-III C-methyltransferase
VTRRGAAESFWVITGTTRNHQLSGDIHLAAKSNATVVILMGMSRFPEIMALFEKEGKGELPVAVIQNGTRADEKVGVGTVKSIVSVVKEQQLSNPAIIVIGEVVAYREQLMQIQRQIALKTL